MKTILLSAVASLAVIGGLVAITWPHPAVSGPEPEVVQVRDDRPAAPRFTKASFEEAVQGKTKAQIRAMFGQPSQVVSLTSDQGWYYPALPIYDADAGTHATVYVQFPIDGDTVGSVKFY